MVSYILNFTNPFNSREDYCGEIERGAAAPGSMKPLDPEPTSTVCGGAVDRWRYL